jgi:exosome complex component RRP42
MSKEDHVIIVNNDTIHQLAEQQKRLDNRAPADYRQPITIETDISWTAEGSAKVQIGDTIVMAGVKLSIEKTYDDTPNEGGIMVNAELLPLSSPMYMPGPPGMTAIELARVLDRGIREAHAIDLKKLCITPGEKAWFVIIDIMSINDAGNLFDACGLAILAALKSAKFPTVKENVIDYKNKTDTPIPLNCTPVSITIWKIGGAYFVDPTAQEQVAADARLTVASTSDGVISAMQKGGDAPLTAEDIKAMTDLAVGKAAFLHKELDKVK